MLPAGSADMLVGHCQLDGSFQMLRTIGAVCACFCVVLVWACRPTGGVVATYRSPNGSYTVQLTGNFFLGVVAAG